MGQLTSRLVAGKLTAYYDAGINVVDSIDAAGAIVAALKPGKRGESYIAAGHNTSLSELVAMMATIAGVFAPQKKLSYASAYVAAILSSLAGYSSAMISLVRHPWHFDNQKMQRELCISPRPLYDTVKDQVEWHMSAMDGG
jgi:dihydroflavonol-4-reductase